MESGNVFLFSGMLLLLLSMSALFYHLDYRVKIKCSPRRVYFFPPPPPLPLVQIKTLLMHMSDVDTPSFFLVQKIIHMTRQLIFPVSEPGVSQNSQDFSGPKSDF